MTTPNEPYAPPSRRLVKWQAVMTPSRLTPVRRVISMGCRPRCVRKTSSRVCVILTGRPHFMARIDATNSSGSGSPFPPNPPPSAGLTTLTRSMGSCSTRDSARCT